MSHLVRQPVVVVGVSGSPSSRSKSRTLLAIVLDVMRDDGAEVHTIDLSTVSADALLARGTAPDVSDAVARVAAAHVVVASTPVYRATYSGLLKTFFDLLPLHALQGKVALGIATGASPGHEGVLEYGLRPLFASLDAVVAPQLLLATDTAFADGEPDASLVSRAREVARGALILADAFQAAAAAGHARPVARSTP